MRSGAAAITRDAESVRDTTLANHAQTTTPKNAGTLAARRTRFPNASSASANTSAGRFAATEAAATQRLPSGSRTDRESQFWADLWVLTDVSVIRSRSQQGCCDMRNQRRNRISPAREQVRGLRGQVGAADPIGNDGSGRATEACSSATLVLIR